MARWLTWGEVGPTRCGDPGVSSRLVGGTCVGTVCVLRTVTGGRGVASFGREGGLNPCL